MARTKSDTRDMGSTSGQTVPSAPPSSAPKTFPRGAPSVSGWTPGPDQAIQGGAGGGGGEGRGGTGGGGGPRQYRAAPSSTGHDLRQLFTGATLRHIIGLPRVMADVILAKISHPDNGSVTTIAKDQSDVYVTFVDVLSGIPGIGRLFSPGNALWRLPRKNDSAMVLKPSEGDGPGIPYIMYGDGGPNSNPVPKFLGQQDSGTFVPENWHVEAGGSVVIKSTSGAGGSGADSATTATIKMNADGSIEITPGAGVAIKMAGGNLAVARITDPVTGQAGPYPLVNGQISGGTARVSA